MSNSAEPAVFIFMHLCIAVYLLISAVMFFKIKTFPLVIFQRATLKKNASSSHPLRGTRGEACSLKNRNTGKI